MCPWASLVTVKNRKASGSGGNENLSSQSSSLQLILYSDQAIPANYIVTVTFHMFFSSLVDNSTIILHYVVWATHIIK
jgi:hypothetical protein